MIPNKTSDHVVNKYSFFIRSLFIWRWKTKNKILTHFVYKPADEPQGQARPTARKPVHIANIAGCKIQKIICETLRAEVRYQTKRPNKES